MTHLLEPLISTISGHVGAASTMGLMPTPERLLDSLGSFATLGLIAIIFAESGLLLGFFLPGDSLLFTAGLFAAKGDLNLAVILLGCFIAAVAGDQVGYLFGKRVGPSLFGRPDSKIFKQKYVAQADAFFQRHGSKTIVLARFVPIVRTFAPILAGVGKMRYRQFVVYNLVGGFVWSFGVILLGYWLGNVAWVKDNIELVLIGIVLISVIPALFEILRHRNEAPTPPA
ncbi:MAG: VTT domain-containing protein [Actinomycetes bacterium]